MQRFGGDWTVLKLDCLRAYLDAYAQVMKFQNQFRTHYIDAFAGTGYVELQPEMASEPGLYEDAAEADVESQRILRGSAELALDVRPIFDSVTFIELNPDRANELQLLRHRHLDAGHSITILPEDANTALRRICAGWDKQGDRAVLFLDPFSISVEWQTLEAVADTESMDVWYLFPLMAVNRLLQRDGKQSPKWEQRLNTLFGTADWRTAFYETKREATLWDNVPVESLTKVGDWDRIRDFLLERLGSIFCSVADNPRFLYNSTRSPLFLLCFAANNSRGEAGPIALRIAKHILRAT